MIYFLSRERLAAVAGFVNGEGTFRCHRGRLGLQVSQKDRRELDSLKEHLCRWGNVWPDRRNRSFVYVLAGFEKTQQAVVMLWPWLSHQKRAQAMRALVEYQEHRAQKAEAKAVRESRATAHTKRLRDYGAIELPEPSV